MKIGIVKLEQVLSIPDENLKIFSRGFTNAQSTKEYKHRIANPVVREYKRFSFDPPRVVAPVKTFNRKHGVLDRQKYVSGEADCLIGKSTAMNKYVRFYCLMSFSSGAEEKYIREFGDLMLSVHDVLLEAGYSPELMTGFCTSSGGQEQLSLIEYGHLDRDLFRHIVSDVDTLRYLGFKSAAMIKNPDNFMDGWEYWKARSFGKPTSLTMDHLRKYSEVPEKSIGCFEKLMYGREKECLDTMRRQLSNGMRAL